VAATKDSVWSAGAAVKDEARHRIAKVATMAVFKYRIHDQDRCMPRRELLTAAVRQKPGRLHSAAGAAAPQDLRVLELD